MATPLPSNLMTDPASPDWLNKGDNAWQLTAATLAGLQSVPGLVILYGSIVKKKWAVNSAFMALYAFAAVLVCWMGWGYQMSFGSAGFHFIGRPNVALDEKFLLDRTFMGYLPNATMVYFQFSSRNKHKRSKYGVVQGWAAIIMGIMSGIIPWYTMMVLHKRIGLLKQVDDTMAVFHTHAVAGSLGGILAGVFAEPKLCRLFYLVDDWEHYVGFFYGLHDGYPRSGVKQMCIQLLGIVFVVVLNIVTTSIICNVVGLVVPLRLSEEELQTGDDAIHGEEAYALWGDGEKERFANSKLNLTYGDNFPTKGEVQMA